MVEESTNNTDTSARQESIQEVKTMEKDIKGLEGLYRITDKGKVISLRQGKVMKTFLNNKGYEIVKLTLGGKSKHFLVHRLVANAYVEGHTDLRNEVNHIDSDKTNNISENLEWVSRRENVRHAIDNGNFNVDKAQKQARISNQKPVVQKGIDGSTIQIFPSIKEASEVTGTSPSKISLVCNGHRKTTNGFKWSFANPDDIV